MSSVTRHQESARLHISDHFTDSAVHSDCVRSDQSSDSVEKTPVMFPSAADTAGGEGAICLSIFNSVNKE